MANGSTDAPADGNNDAISATAPDAQGDAASTEAGFTGSSAEDGGAHCTSGDSGCAFVLDAGSLGDARAPYHALAVTAGMEHTCVLLDDHKVKCWGENAAGELGLGDTMPRGANAGELGDNLPTVDLGTGHSAVAIAAGFTATCAILENGQVKCWGQLGGTGGGPTPGSMPGQMGDNLPALDLGGHKALAVAPGERGGTILLDDGSVWGWNLSQPVGPLEGVPANRRAVMITPQSQYPPAPVLLDDGTAVGVAAAPYQDAPVSLLSPGETARGLFRSQNLPGLCATLERGGLRCNASLDYSPVADAPTNGPPLRSDFASLAIGQEGELLCALTFDGQVQCWGDLSSSGWAPAPGGGFTAPTDDTVVAISPGGADHFCALLADGTVECFGGDGPALGRGGSTSVGPVDLGTRNVFPDADTCATSTQCLGQAGAQGQLCVLSHCAPCTKDPNCRFDAYSAHAGLTMCNIAAGKCVSPSCAAPGASCGSGANTNGNGADLCCGATSATCVAGGACCTSRDCSAGQSCFRHACVSCGAPSGATYYVDPYLGSDDSESGGNGSSSCPFQSVTHAVAVVASTGTSATIAIANPGPMVPLLDERTGEVFPIVVPQGIAITDSASPTLTGLGFSMGYFAPPVVGIRDGQTGFVLASPNSSLSNVSIDGEGANDTGIAVFAGADGVTTQIDGVTLTNLGTAGIAIGAVAGEAHAGHAALVGVSTSQADIFISGDGSATITGGASLDGLTVKDSASVAITGTISVDTIDNVPGAVDATGDTMFSSISILQTPGATAMSQINGALVYGQLQVSAGSHLRLRGSWVTAGVTVSTSVTNVPTDDLTTIDLGSSVGPDYGLNVFVSNTNPGSPGLCLEVKPNSGTLRAAGNRFASTDQAGLVEPSVDCTTGGTVSRSPSCNSTDAEIDIGGIAAGDSTHVDVTHCQ